MVFASVSPVSFCMGGTCWPLNVVPSIAGSAVWDDAAPVEVSARRFSPLGGAANVDDIARASRLNNDQRGRMLDVP